MATRTKQLHSQAPTRTVDHPQYHAELTRADYSYGTLEMTFGIPSQRNGYFDLSLRLGYTGLERVFDGDKIVNHNLMRRKAWFFERYGLPSEKGNIPFNLAYKLMLTIGLNDRDCPEFHSKSFRPITSREIEEIDTSKVKQDRAFMSLDFYREMLKKSALRVLEADSRTRGHMKELTSIVQALESMSPIKNRIVKTNMGLVKTMIKCLASRCDIDDLRNAGTYALFKAMDGFDWKRGYRFSTYACNAIKKELQKCSAEEWTYKDKNPFEWTPLLERDDLIENQRTEEVTSQTKEIRRILEMNLADLNQNQLTIIKHRFGFKGKSKTLRETGNIVHLTRERVRQIQKAALKKLKKSLR